MKRNTFESINSFGLYLWLTLVSVSLLLYVFQPELFDPQRIHHFFSTNLEKGLFFYFVISTLRGFTLIPSTPLVLAGILVFPPLPLFLVNQLAVYSSSAIVYYLARHFGFDQFFHSRYPAQISRLTLLLRRRELPVISLWGFAPFVPSDVIVYACSVLRINVWKTLLGISIGEGAICFLYIFGGSLSLEALLSLFS